MGDTRKETPRLHEKWAPLKTPAWEAMATWMNWLYRLFSFTWSAAVQISQRKKVFTSEKSLILTGFFRTRTWPPCFCFVPQYCRRDVMWKGSIWRKLESFYSSGESREREGDHAPPSPTSYHTRQTEEFFSTLVAICRIIAETVSTKDSHVYRYSLVCNLSDMNLSN